MKLPPPISIDPLSFFVGAAIAALGWWILTRSGPIWKQLRENARLRREVAAARRMGGVESDHRRATLRRAQGMHLASSLFALDEIIEEPAVVAPPARVVPGDPLGPDDAVTLTLPYLPAWPELGAIYGAPTLSLPEALAGGANVVIIGQPGAGKTVALAHLASALANQSAKMGALRERVPFFLHVAELRLPVTERRDLLSRLIELTSDRISGLAPGRVEAFVQSSFRSGLALLLLDGFDELTAQGQNEVSAFLGQLLREFPRIRIVTTGAPEQLDGLVALGFVPLTVAAWSSQRQNHFIQRWGEMWSAAIAFQSWAQDGVEMVDPLVLGSWLGLNNQSLSPLELTLKVWAAYGGDAAGANVLDAIEAHVRRLAPPGLPLAALEALAMQVMLTAQPMFDPRRARTWVKDFELPDEVDVTPESARDGSDASDQMGPATESQRSRSFTVPVPTAGLLGRLASSGLLMQLPGNKLRFVHPVLGGFLAGRALSAYKAEETLLNQPDWIGKVLTMRFFAAHAEVGWLVNTVLQWSRLPMQRPLLSAARWLRDAPRDAAWRGRLLAALAQLLQTDGLPFALRGQALAGLVLSGDPGAAALFRQLTRAESSDLVQLAALGSGAIRDDKAVGDLEGVLRSPSIAASRAACLALVAIGTAPALELVAHALLGGDENMRRAAAEALANDPTEGHAMLRDGAGMQDIMLRRAAVYGLGRVHEPWAKELLEKMRLEDEQWVVRNSADQVIESNNAPDDPRIPRPLTPPSETPWIIALAGEQGAGVAPGAPATDLLLTALKNPDEEIRLAAIPYLKRNPSDGTVRQLYEAMFGREAELREAAFLSLWEIGASGYKLPDPSQYGLS